MPRAFAVACLVACLVAPGLSSGCVSGSHADAPLPGAIRGSVRGLGGAGGARVAVYRLESTELAIRMPGAEAAVDRSGRFRTGVVTPGRYLLALEAPGLPPSVVRTVVPTSPEIVLRARKPLAPGALEIRRGPSAAEARGIVLSRVESGLPICDRRTASFEGDASVRFDGLAAGRWRVDLVGTGWTTEVDVPDAGVAVAELDPPALPPLASAVVRGQALRLDGTPAPNLAVTLRALVEDPETHGTSAARWGRYALTDSDGGYVIVAVPGVRSLLRIECRDSVYPRVPHPEAVGIPPSGEVLRSFVIRR